MALPRFPEARWFYQAAWQRFQDAEFLLEGERTTGSVYLAGYTVECIFKALVLSVLGRPKDRQDMVKSFRGTRAHDFGWLKAQYLEKGGVALPREVARHLALVNTWTTDMRYKPGSIRRREAEAFVRASKEILTWADGRF